MCSKNRSLNIQMVDFTQAGDAFDPQAELNDALARMNVPPKSAWVEIKVSYVITNHKYIYIYILIPCHRRNVTDYGNPLDPFCPGGH